jgi:hypothetical protein
MPLYMIQVAYTPEAKAALAQVPEDRSIVFGGLVQGMGDQGHATGAGQRKREGDARGEQAGVSGAEGFCR